MNNFTLTGMQYPGACTFILVCPWNVFLAKSNFCRLGWEKAWCSHCQDTGPISKYLNGSWLPGEIFVRVGDKEKSFINTGHLVSNKSMGTSLKKFLRRDAAGTEKNGITVDFETTSWSCKSEWRLVLFRRETIDFRIKTTYLFCHFLRVPAAAGFEPLNLESSKVVRVSRIKLGQYRLTGLKETQRK